MTPAASSIAFQYGLPSPGEVPHSGAMTLSSLPWPSFFGTDTASWSAGSAVVKPSAEPFLLGMSGVTAFEGT